MLKDIVEVRPLEGYRLWLRFEDGIEGTVDVAEMIRFQGVFALLRDRENFLRVRVDSEIGTVCWPASYWRRFRRYHRVTAGNYPWHKARGCRS